MCSNGHAGQPRGQIVLSASILAFCLCEKCDARSPPLCKYSSPPKPNVRLWLMVLPKELPACSEAVYFRGFRVLLSKPAGLIYLKGTVITRGHLLVVRNAFLQHTSFGKTGIFLSLAWNTCPSKLKWAQRSVDQCCCLSVKQATRYLSWWEACPADFREEAVKISLHLWFRFTRACLHPPTLCMNSFVSV